ncbi:hypothetical protein AB0C01_16395 [Micromonospora sp. NPDC048905]|uniref:hypothetical protein n=1 Tax=Micromonospora sp. NPDC048905 TaxID=3155494 RepID=UPI0033D178E4
MTAELASGLRFAAQPVVSVFVPGVPAEVPEFADGDVVPIEVLTYSLERDDPYACVTEYDLVFDELPPLLHPYLAHCLRVACAAGDTVVWLGFEGSFDFDQLLIETLAPQVYGVCAPGGEPVVAKDLSVLRTPEWRAVIASHGSLL